MCARTEPACSGSLGFRKSQARLGATWAYSGGFLRLQCGRVPLTMALEVGTPLTH